MSIGLAQCVLSFSGHDTLLLFQSAATMLQTHCAGPAVPAASLKVVYEYESELPHEAEYPRRDVGIGRKPHKKHLVQAWVGPALRSDWRNSVR